MLQNEELLLVQKERDMFKHELEKFITFIDECNDKYPEEEKDYEFSIDVVQAQRELKKWMQEREKE